MPSNPKKIADKAQKRLEKLDLREKGIKLNMDKYDNSPEWKLPEPKPLMTLLSNLSSVILSTLTRNVKSR